ncbi:deoxyribonuclease II [Balamuthia mandrillaris]
MKGTVAVVLFVVAAVCVAVRASPQCLDEKGKPVDWWVIMKAPIDSGSKEPSYASGYGYSYADKNSPSLKWTEKRLDNNTKGALASTVQQIYDATKSKQGWLMWNDQGDDGSSHNSYGHTKGDLVFDGTSAFWLIHSVPRWPEAKENATKYEFPENEKIYGQSFLCITLPFAGVETVAQALLVSKPYVYSSNVPSTLSKKLPNVNLLLDHKFITRQPMTFNATLASSGGNKFIVATKNALWADDIYEGLVAPLLDADIYVETWMNGADANKMPSYCRTEYKYNVINVRQVTLTDKVSWPETKDHSKWAVTVDDDTPFFCVSGVNRQFSQSKRGGGVVRHSFFSTHG